MNPKQGERSHLFLVRFWKEAVQDGQDGKEAAQERQDGEEWRGRVQDVLSGEARAFEDWASLIDLLLEMAETEPLVARAPRGKAKEVIR